MMGLVAIGCALMLASPIWLSLAHGLKSSHRAIVRAAGGAAPGAPGNPTTAGGSRQGIRPDLTTSPRTGSGLRGEAVRPGPLLGDGPAGSGRASNP